MDKRNLFEELKTSLEDVKAFEEEKITLKTMTIQDKYNMYPDMFERLKKI